MDNTEIIYKLYSWRKFEELEAFCKKHLDDDTDIDTVYAYLVYGSIAQKNLLNAIKYSKEYIEVTENVAFGEYLKSTAYMQFGYNKAALSALQKAIDILPEVSVLYQRRAEINLCSNNYFEAIKDYGKALELEEKPEYYVERAKLFVRFNAYKAIIENLDKATELDKNNHFLYFDIGKAYKFMGKHDCAIKNFDKAIELNSEYFYSYIERAESFDELKQSINCVKDIIKSLKLMNEFFIYNLKLRFSEFINKLKNKIFRQKLHSL